MVKTYILAPNQTTGPDDLLKLGHILDDIKDITEFEPLNPDDVVPVDKTRIHHQPGFTSSLKKVISGGLGIFARVLGLIGIGPGAGIHYSNDEGRILSCQSLDTQTFHPNMAYIEKCMELFDIQSFMKAADYKAPVYLVTGLKIGRGSSFESTNTVSRGGRLDLSINLPGVPVEVGPSAAFDTTTTEGESWEGPTDFVVAYRVKKIWYRRGRIEIKNNKTGVVMQDGGVARRDRSYSLDISDDITISEITAQTILAEEKDVEDEGEGPEEIHWVIPGHGITKA